MLATSTFLMRSLAISFQQISSKNVESRQQQDNMHMMGLVSFARKYYDMVSLWILHEFFNIIILHDFYLV